MGPFGLKRAIRASEPLVVTSQFSLREIRYKMEAVCLEAQKRTYKSG